MKKSFEEVFIDKTRYGTKIKTDEYCKSGKHIIVDQSQNAIAGFTDLDSGLFTDVPAIIFGDHTRVIKYVDEPFFLGADGTKILRSNICNANYKYLYYALKNARIPNTGYNRHFKWLKEIEIQYPDEKTQDSIVSLLDKVLYIINLRKDELQKLDDLIKARFVEMFGNPLDKSKANMYFVECVEFNPKKSEVKDLMCETVSFVPMECVGADGSFKIKEDGLVKDYYKGYTYFKNGDVLLAKITPCFENGKVAIAENCTNGIGFGTTEFHVSRPIPGVSNSQWIKYMLKNEHVHELATINMTGSAGQKRIQTPFFEKLKVYLPPIELQNQFADFVAQIDKSKLLSGCRFFHSWVPANRDDLNHVGVPRRRTKDLREGRRQHAHLHH